jgi:hypothetical protein
MKPSDTKVATTIDPMSQNLRSQLWKVLEAYLFINSQAWPLDKKQQLINRIVNEFFENVIELSTATGEPDPNSFREWFEDWIYTAETDKVFDCIEFMIQAMDIPGMGKQATFINECNKALENDNSAFRIINKKVVRVIMGADLEEIEQAFKGSTPMEPVNRHFSKALELLAERKSPNYRYSILEAIAAVDSLMLQFPSQRVNGEVLLPITANPNSLVSIKYALIEGDMPVSFQKARYWLLSCAAIINHLRAKTG